MEFHIDRPVAKCVRFHSICLILTVAAGLLCGITSCSSNDPAPPTKDPQPSTAGIEAPKERPATAEIEVSKETTHWTEPLDAQGRVDYVAIMNAIDGKGVTPEENGFVAYFMLMRPLKDKPELEAAYCRLLGIGPPSEDWPRFVRHEKFDISQEKMDEAESARWVQQHYPKLANWINANLENAAILAAASNRPYFFIPELHSDSMTPEELFGEGSEREFNPWKSLLYLHSYFRLRAMLYLNEGKVDEAFSDILLRQRPMHALMRQSNVTWRSIGCGLASRCLQEHCVLLASTNQPTEWYLAKAGELAKLPNMTSVEGLRRSLEYDRATALSDLSNAAEGRTSSLDYIVFFDGLFEDFKELGIKRRLDHDLIKEARRLADWNEVLRTANRWYDRLGPAADEPTYRDATRFVQRLAAEGGQWKKSMKPPAKDALSQDAATQFVSRFAIPPIIEAAQSGLELNETAECTLRMVRLSYLLAAWRADHDGRYPDSLDALVPKYTAALLHDPFTGKPFGYHTVKNGYVLYSPGPSGTFDDPEKMGFTRRLGTYDEDNPEDADFPFSYDDEDNIGLIIRHESSR